MNVVFFSLGSNVEPVLHLRSGVAALQRLYGAISLSRVFESEAVGFVGDNFLNLVARVETTQSVAEIQQHIKQIEDEHGRIRDGIKYSARCLDIDLLLYNDLIQPNTGELSPELPRAEILTNAFVLQPMAELAPHWVHPTAGQTMAALWQAYKQSQKLWPVDFDWC